MPDRAPILPATLRQLKIASDAFTVLSRALAGLHAIVAIVCLVTLVLVLQANDMVISVPAGIANFCRTTLSLLVWIVVAIWFARGIRLSLDLGATADELKHSAQKTIWCLFLPFVNLVIPWLALQQLHQLSRKPAFWWHAPANGLIWVWGFFYATPFLAGMVVAFCVIGRYPGVSNQELGQYFGAILFPSWGLMASLLFIPIVLGIARGFRERVAEVEAGGVRIAP